MWSQTIRNIVSAGAMLLLLLVLFDTIIIGGTFAFGVRDENVMCLDVFNARLRNVHVVLVGS